MWLAVVLVVGASVAVLAAWLRVFREYERGVIFLLGRFQTVEGPGLPLVIPVFQKSVRIDLRLITSIAFPVPMDSLQSLKATKGEAYGG